MSPMVSLPLTIEHALLGFLRHQPLHGYEIHQQLLAAEGVGLIWTLKQSQLYALLGKLESAGLVEASIESREPRPPRKILHLTPQGEQAFLQWLASPVEQGRNFRLEFLAKLYFAQQEGPDAIRALLDAQRSLCFQWLARQQRAADEEGAPFEQLVHHFRAGQVQAMLHWLDQCEATLLSSLLSPA